MANMDQMQVDRAQMLKAAGQIEAATNQINNIQTNMDQAVRGLIGRGWQGNAAQAFLKAHVQVDQRFGEVKAGLDEIHTKLAASQTDYTTNESNMEAASSPLLGKLNF